MYIVTHNNLGRCLSVPHLCSKYLLVLSYSSLRGSFKIFLTSGNFNQERILVDAVSNYYIDVNIVCRTLAVGNKIISSEQNAWPTLQKVVQDHP